MATYYNNICKSKSSEPKTVLFIPLLLLLSTINCTAQGNLLVTPKRIVLEGIKRSEEINLANTGKDSATYVINFIQLRMKDDGSVETITDPDPGQNFADKYVRIFPRRVTLAPNEAQTIKLQVTKTNELSPGEYRSHLYFRAVPNETPLGEKNEEKDSSISVKLIPIFGISIPVIVRNGESTTKVDLSDAALSFDKDNPLLNITFNRSGNMSVYGDIVVDYISSAGKTIRVGSIKGMAIYTPNLRRYFKLPLDKNKSVDYHSGKLHLVYNDQSPKPVKLAETDVILN